MNILENRIILYMCRPLKKWRKAWTGTKNILHCCRESGKVYNYKAVQHVADESAVLGTG